MLLALWIIVWTWQHSPNVITHPTYLVWLIITSVITLGYSIEKAGKS